MSADWETRKEKAKSGSPEAPAGARREAGIRDGTR